MKVPAVIELACLNREERCLLTLFLLTRISEYLKTVPKAGKTLRYIIIIEEAHNIVGCSDEARVSPDIADPKAFAAEYVCNMLAELRALGVGIIIVDQTPSVVAPEVIKNTTTKLIFRLQHEADRKVVGASMLMGSLAMEELGYLNPGEAFLFTEGYREPRRIRMGV
jgi:DNA helicase HerA-like ATPase